MSARAPTRIATCALLALAGCSGKPAPPAALTAHAERGPFRFDAVISPAAVRVGDPVRIALTVRTPEGYDVQMPDAKAFGDLLVDRLEAADPRPGVESGLVWLAEGSGVVLQAGPLEIPPLVARYGPRGEGDDALRFENELVTDTLTLPVAGVLTTQEAGPRDIRGPLDLPARPLTAWEWTAVIGGALAAIAIATLLAWFVLIRVRRPAPPVPPEIWALEELRRLSVEGELAAGRDAYYRVSEIVRAYIERKFAIAASEMTTEEFLRAVSTERFAAGDARVRRLALAILRRDLPTLREFLEACDLVKYAALPAGEGQFQHAIGVARNFVERSAAQYERETASVPEAAA